MYLFLNSFCTSFVRGFLYLSCIVAITNNSELTTISSYFEVLSAVHKAQLLDYRETVSVIRDSSWLRCAMQCNKVSGCMVAGYQPKTGVCRTFGPKTKGKESAETIEKTRIMYLKKLGYYDENTGQFVGIPKKRSCVKKLQIYRSCKEVYVDHKSSGVYKLTLFDGTVVNVYCLMRNINGCGGGGWGLAMKINGTESTFTYTSVLWSNNKSHNYPRRLAKLDREEMKSPIFWGTPVTKICVGMKSSAKETNWLLINQTLTSLQSVFTSNVFHPTNLERRWLKILKGSNLQSTICAEGLNVVISTMKLRIGIIGSRTSCANPTAFMGFGNFVKTSCGNVVFGIPFKLIQAFGYVLIQ